MTANRYASFLASLPERIKFKLYGYRIGLGKPVPEEAFDREYSSGAWDTFFGDREFVRYETLLSMIDEEHKDGIRILDVGCGSGRLPSLLDPGCLKGYLGIDLSPEGLRMAGELALQEARFQQANFEEWLPEKGAFDLILFNESIGYARDPLKTSCRFAERLADGGRLMISQLRFGNYIPLWKRIERDFDVVEHREVSNQSGETWDIKLLARR